MGPHVHAAHHRVTGRILFIVVAVATFAIDRFSKLMVRAELEVGEHVSVVGDLFELRHIRNTGIAFGMFSGMGQVIVFGSLIVGVLLFVFMLRVEPDDLMTVLGGALITGGAMGNLVDRVQHSYVTDFLHLPRFPTFNVADIAITFGVIFVIVAQVRVAIHESRSEGES